MNEKLVVVIMGQNCEKFISMCLESVKDADAIVYCDGGSTDGTLVILDKNNFNDIDDEFKLYPKSKKIIIRNEYNQEDKGMNGKQRNFYLDYVKKNYPGYWCLCIDADEVVENLKDLKKFIQFANDGVYSVKMRHFIGDLGHEDTTIDQHLVLHRLFKVSEAISYPEEEHPVLIPKNLMETKDGLIGLATDCTTIWHLAYIPNLWAIKKRYENHLKKSNMHSPDYLKNWHYSHILGSYPKKRLNLIDIPRIILEEFGINPDEIYFITHKELELKHFVMFKEWIDKFNPKSIIDWGCGVGLYGYVAKYNNIDYTGIELSQWAVEHSKVPIKQGNLLVKTEDTADLVLLIDVLEHLELEDLDKALENVCKNGKNFIFSLPYIGDVNLDQDPTHRIKETREWWVNKLSEYFKISDAPKEWSFSHQLLIGEQK